MKTLRRICTNAAILGTATAIFYGLGTAAATESATTSVNSQVPKGFVDSDILPGEVVWDDAQRHGVVVPSEPGQRVDMRGLHTDGTEISVTALVDSNGKVKISRENTADISQMNRPDEKFIVNRNINGCSDGAYAHTGTKWLSNFSIWTSSTNRPSYILQSAFQSNNIFGMASITGTRNNCGYPDVVPIVVGNNGNTTTQPNIPQSGGGVVCGTPDGSNVAGFGPFGGPGTLGTNCTWSTWNGTVYASYETDTKLNYAHYWTGNPTSCPHSGQNYVIRAILAHEWGHGFGLQHPAGSHPTLTMNATANGPCSDDMSWLGLGDILGLDALY